MLSEPAVETLVGVALVITVAYTVFGMTGFGSSITAMPLLAHPLPLRTAVPMMLLLDLCAGLLLGLRNRSAVERTELLRLVPYMLAGMAIGVTLLVKAPERVLLFVLGSFVLAYSAWTLLIRASAEPIATGWSAPLGTVGGVFTALRHRRADLHHLPRAPRSGQAGAAGHHQRSSS